MVSSKLHALPICCSSSVSWAGCGPDHVAIADQVPAGHFLRGCTNNPTFDAFIVLLCHEARQWGRLHDQRSLSSTPQCAGQHPAGDASRAGRSRAVASSCYELVLWR